MNSELIIGMVALGVAGLSAVALAAYVFMPKTKTNLRSLMGQGGSSELGSIAEERARLKDDPTGKEFERLKKAAKAKAAKKQPLTLDEKFFHAGVFSDEDKKEFFLIRTICPVILGPVVGLLASNVGVELMVIGLVIGGLFGYRIPYMMLDRRIKFRYDDILYYLPLVIEQVVIGVSSSLDIGPCLQRVVSMADERDSHNAVTELVALAHHYVRSGVGLEDALTEVGKRSGHTELKHAFMALAQVAKHGGEVSKQLQELADAVSNQREAKIETKIKKLELEATMPVAVVFCGFLLIIISGFGIQVKNAFK